MSAERKSTWTRRVVAVVLAGAIALGLSACDSFLADPVAFTVIDGTPVVRICIPLTVNRIQISTYATEDSNADVIWSARGSEAYPAGSELVLGAVPEGFVAGVDDQVDWLPTTIAVKIDVKSVKGGSWQTFSYIEAGSLVEDVWLDGYGTPTDQPCVRGECMPGSAC